jgi:hypothetical protein
MRQMMIAVALSPIVLYAGQWAGKEWPTIVSVDPASLPPKVVPALPVSAGPYEAIGVAIIRVEFSTRAALLAMAATTALLTLAWVLVARSIRRISST